MGYRLRKTPILTLSLSKELAALFTFLVTLASDGSSFMKCGKFLCLAPADLTMNKDMRRLLIITKNEKKMGKGNANLQVSMG